MSEPAAVHPPVYLTGFMGSGKTTVGPLVAERLGRRFFDLDALVEAETGETVATLFAQQGEEAFRQYEAAALRATRALGNAVVGLGGGTLMWGDNADAVCEAGPLVYLRVSADELTRRLAPTVATRPLLWAEGGQYLDKSGLHQRIAVLLEQRGATYERAALIIDAEAAPDTVAKRICNALTQENA